MKRHTTLGRPSYSLLASCVIGAIMGWLLCLTWVHASTLEVRAERERLMATVDTTFRVEQASVDSLQAMIAVLPSSYTCRRTDGHDMAMEETP